MIMKKFTLLVALLCASLFTFADEIQSEYCGEVMLPGDNREAAFSWETDEAGVITITVTETLGGTMESTHFRGNGINIDKIKVGEQREDAANYFTLKCGGKPTITLTPIEGKSLPLGTKIYVESQIIEYATSKDTNAWPTLTFIYTYGGVCSAEPVLTRINLSAPVAFAKVGEPITLNVSPVDQMGRLMDVDVVLSVSPADAGSFNGYVYTPAKVGAATVTAKSGDVTATINVYGVESDNLALNKPCEAGYEPENKDELSSKANDGKTNTQWVTYADKPASVEWWIVDLGDLYSISAVDVLWGDPTSTKYIIQLRDEAPSDEDKANDDAWETIATREGVTINSEQFITVRGHGRYLRLHSLAKSANFFRLKEVRVFGSEWVPVDDTEKPVMVAATLESKSAKNAVIRVSATDDVLVKAFHVVDAAKGIDMRLVDTDGKITVSPLTPATAYNFTVTVFDASGKESDNSIVVPVTTDDIIPLVSAPVPQWPAKQVKSIYSDAYTFAPASLNSYNEGWWQNPRLTEEVIDGDHFLHYDLYQVGMIGAQFAELPVMTMEKMHIDVYASVSGTVTFRWITMDDPDAVNTVRKTLKLDGGRWNSFDFDLKDFGNHNWARLFQFSIENYGDGGLVGEHLSVDNIYLYRTTELIDNDAPTNLTVTKVSEGVFSAVLAVSAEDNSGAVNFAVMDGEKELVTSGAASGTKVNITVPNLIPGTEYNLSVIATDDAGNAAEPVAVAVTTQAGPAPAPVPALDGKPAVPVFCDALDGNPYINIGNWAQTTQAQVGLLAEGDRVYYCTNMNYLGWELAPAVDATDMNMLHADFYTTEMTSVQLTPISPNHEGIYTVTLKQGEWTSADIPLSTFAAANIVWSNIFQFKFMEAAPAGKSLFIDNVYFYKTDEAAVEHTSALAPAAKCLRDGQLFILRDGKTFTLQGVQVK